MATTSTESSAFITASLMQHGSSIEGAPIRKDLKDQLNCLELIDIGAFADLQYSISGPSGKSHHLGSLIGVGSLDLGSGGSFIVRRVLNSLFVPSLGLDKGFVVIKQPSVHKDKMKTDFEKKLYDVLMDLKVLYHSPLREHPNIVKLHRFMWDTQSNLATALAPSLVVEYADLGTLSDFQDPKRLVLHADAKLRICHDVAEGLSFLHKCAIIHGDVKCLNVLLFRDSTGNPRKATGIRAKISDFGSAVIGVLDNCPKQKRRGRTALWDAPEAIDFMDALSLRRMDMYSYGLMVWQIMCNGEVPYRRLYWNPRHSTISSEPTTDPPIPLKEGQFNSLKNTDSLFRLAIDTLRNRPASDTNISKVENIFRVTLRLDPSSRAESFDEIAQILGLEGNGSNISTPKPEPLKAGDFGVTLPSFPHTIFLLRTSPPSFRAMICDQLLKNIELSESESQKSLCSLALGVCLFQDFDPISVKEEGSSRTSALFRQDMAHQQITDAAYMGNPIAQSLAPTVLTRSSSPSINKKTLEEWLFNSMRHGSLRARNELKQRFPVRFAQVVAFIKETRHRVRSQIAPNDAQRYDSNYFENFPSLDPAAKDLLSQPEISRLHQAAYLGAVQVCKDLIDNRGYDVDTLYLNCTPLHYASRNCQVEVAQYLLEKGANINAQNTFGASALHFALISFNPEDMLSLLLNRGADPNLISRTTLEGLPDRCDYFMSAVGTPLHFAIRCQNTKAVKILLEGGANPNKKCDYRVTPLQCALQMHSIPLFELVLPYATADIENLPVVHDIYHPLVGYFVQPMFKWLYWLDQSPLQFILPAVELIKKHGLCVDERGLLAWAIDLNAVEIAEYYLEKFFTIEKTRVKRFRLRRVPQYDETTYVKDVNFTRDLAPMLFGVIQGSCSKEIIKAVLKYAQKPLPTCGGLGVPFLCTIGWRQLEPREDLAEIVSLLVEAGADITATIQRMGPVRNACTFNNDVAADVLLDYGPSFTDVQEAMGICARAGRSMTAAKIMRSILKKCPQILVTPLKPLENNVASGIATDFNFLRTFISTVKFSRSKSPNASSNTGLLREVIQKMKEEPRAVEALKERLSQCSLIIGTPLHYAASGANVDAAKLLLSEGANINSYYVFPAKADELSIDLSAFTCETDLSKLDPVQKLWMQANSGPTPLDHALNRDWQHHLYLWPTDVQSLAKEFWFSGGSFKEEEEYENQTQKIVDFLKARDAKTHDELFGLPDHRKNTTEAWKASLTGMETKLKERNTPKPQSDCEQRIRRFNCATFSLPSHDFVMNEYPDLLQKVDPTRPRFSKLFTESISQFNGILTSPGFLRDMHFCQKIQEQFSIYQNWAKRNNVEEGNLDGIADIPKPTFCPALAAGLLVCFCEIKQTLSFIEELIADPIEWKDRGYRCTELLNDLEKVVKILTAEEMSLKELSDIAVAELASKRVREGW